MLAYLSHTHAPTSAPTGGLGPEVTEQVLHAAFIPFGEVTTVQIPMDMRTRMAFPPAVAEQHHDLAQLFMCLPFDALLLLLLLVGTTEKNRGFGFVEFQNPDDADDAIDNMDGAFVGYACYPKHKLAQLTVVCRATMNRG